GLYSGTYTPTSPQAPGLSPLVHKGPPPANGGAKVQPVDSTNGSTATPLDNSTSTRGSTLPGQQPPKPGSTNETPGSEASETQPERGTTTPGAEPGKAAAGNEALGNTRGTTAVPSTPPASQSPV